MKVKVIVKASKSYEAGVMPSTELLAAMGNSNEALVKAGILLAGDGLHPSSNGKRVRFIGKDRTVIDGPFTETKEQLLGFYIVDCKDLDEALEFARELGVANPGGAYEIRPVGMLMPGMSAP